VFERFRHGAAGANLEIGHVDVGSERGIGDAELTADPIQRRLHGQARVGADDQKVHEIGESRLVFEAFSLDAAVEIKLGTR